MTDSMTFVTIFVFGLFVGVGILFLMAKLTECFSRAIELYIKKQKTYESKIKYRQETQKTKSLLSLLERDKPKRPTHVYDGEEVCDCGQSCEYEWNFCARCGQRLDWRK